MLSLILLGEEMIKNVVEKYNEWQVGEVFYVHERGNYGFRIYLKYPDGSKRIRQRSGFKTKKLADEERRIVISRLVEGKYVAIPVYCIFGTIHY